MANAESLPFKDASFDAYFSNLCLMHVHNHRNQLKECFRVLQPGARAAFSVWGRPERSAAFSLFYDCLKEVGGEQPHRLGFHLGEDPQILVNDMTQAGFT